MDVWSSTQKIRDIQHSIAQATGRPMHSIHVTVPAIGGGFGGKISNPSIIGVPVAMAAEVLNKPVRMVMSLHDNLKTAMKRVPMLFKYKVGVNSDGRIMSVITDVYIDLGKSPTKGVFFVPGVMRALSGAYNIPNWMIRCHLMKTDHRETCVMRAPVWMPTTYFMETLMEHVAKELSRDPVDMRMINLRQPGKVCSFGRPETEGSLSRIWEELRETSNYEKRQIQIQEFNKMNRWKKRAMSVVPIGYQVSYVHFNFGCFLAVYADDGSVAVSHGGVEMGQGVNTKVCQAVAQTFEIPLELVHCQPTNSLTGANCAVSAGSVTSELCVKAAIEACKIIQNRMAPVRQQHPEAAWTDLVSLCHEGRIDLTAEYRCSPGEAFPCKTYGMCVAEAEVDILAGLYQTNRVDILMDLGVSMNPMLDVGQIEGAFVMGMGYMLMEKEIMDPKTGRILSDSTQSYKVPMAQDIPVDFRVSLLKDSTSVHGVTKSKAVGEPPICLAPSVLFAIRAAIEASREQRGYKPKFLRVDAPLTVEQVQRLAEVTIDQLTLE